MIREVNPKDYDIPYTGQPEIHENLAWYATDDNRVVGVVVLDKVDNDFSWVVLTAIEGAYTAADLDHSLPSQQAATDALHKAMQLLVQK